jgi:Oxidoreductase family, NAD-binding Rossmann fold
VPRGIFSADCGRFLRHSSLIGDVPELDVTRGSEIVPTRDGKLGVGITGIGWCAAQHLAAFQRNRQTVVTWLHGRDASRVQSNLTKYNVAAAGARITTTYEDLLEADDVGIIAIATPNHLHARQAV